MTLAAHREELALGQNCEIRGISGQGFVSSLAVLDNSGSGCISRVRVPGEAHYMALSDLIIEPSGVFGNGFSLPERFSGL